MDRVSSWILFCALIESRIPSLHLRLQLVITPAAKTPQQQSADNHRTEEHHYPIVAIEPIHPTHRVAVKLAHRVHCKIGLDASRRKGALETSWNSRLRIPGQRSFSQTTGITGAIDLSDPSSPRARAFEELAERGNCLSDTPVCGISAIQTCPFQCWR
jgi:hypothetical protein